MPEVVLADAGYWHQAVEVPCPGQGGWVDRTGAVWKGLEANA
jgi:hypothetical protein